MFLVKIFFLLISVSLGVEARCGGVLEQRKGTIQSPNYPNNYLDNTQCIWKIIVEPESYVVLTFQAFEVEKGDTCGADFVEIRDGPELDSPLLARFCGSNIPEVMRSSSNTMFVRFVSDSSVVRMGFSANFVSVNHDCYRNPLSPDKRCNGIKDCEEGLDEKNCDFVALSEDFFALNRKLATRWMRSQHDADWGWKDNTARAIIGLYLSNDLNFNTSSHEDDLVAKQLELEISTFLLRNAIEKTPITEMATYISALQAICHNVRNFYGFDLVQKMKEEIDKTPNYKMPFPYLTLCNAKEAVSESAIESLLQLIDKRSDFGFALEIQALASMTLSCISRNDQYAYLKQNVTQHLNKIKEKQREDGSFGNEYTTALVIQALIANNQGNDMDWEFEAAAEYLQKKQKPDGSFGDFLTTYLIMPVMNGKSLVDLSRINCTETQNRPREGNPVTDLKNRLGGKIPVKYSLIVGDDKDQVFPILLRTPENITVLDLMNLAADIDPKYKFKTHQMEEKMYVYEIFSIPNDPEKNKFWFLYQQIGNDTEVASKQSPDEVYVGENYHMIMWYRTLNM